MKLAIVAMALSSALIVVSSGPGSVVAARGAEASVAASPAAQRFLSRTDPPLVRFTARRHLEASTRQGKMRAWMDACTELTDAGFRYRVLDEGGSGTIRAHVLRAALEAEEKARTSGDANRAALTSVNYEFAGGDDGPDGLTRVAVRPLRKDVLLVDGAMFLTPADGDLVRVEGLLSKRPSFWTRRVYIVRRYARVADVRVPIAMESTADVLIVGKSSFAMTYDYASVNGEPVPGHVPAADACVK